MKVRFGGAKFVAVAAACMAVCALLAGCSGEARKTPEAMWAADSGAAIADADDVVKIEIVNTVHQELFYSYVSAASSDVTDEVVQEWYDTCVKPGSCVWYMVDFVDQTEEGGTLCHGVWGKRGCVYMGATFERQEHSGYTNYELLDYEYSLAPDDDGVLVRAE